jgi:hypothetical protein
MCLLVTQSKISPKLSHEWLKDFYSYNADGIGVMRSKNNQLIIEKILPKDADDFINFYEKHIFGFDCAFHLRMKTHGNIDLINCHPYEVLNKADHGIDLWLMHNGILHTDNKADITKSDTWHYIKNYLVPMLAKNPDYAFTESFNEIISDHIGSSNKFVLMDNLGRQTVINQDQGVYWAGLWLSNTYAWSASNTATETAENNLTLWESQILENPDKPQLNYGYYNYGPYNNYSSDYYYQENSHNLDNNYIDNEIDLIVNDFFDLGHDKAGSLSYTQAKRFITRFGLASFQDLSIMVLDNQIDEHTFIRSISDYTYAKSIFEWLSSEESKIARAENENSYI